MNKFRFTIKVLAIATFMVAFASIAQAQASRTWVSGVGDDANPCSRTAPCKTWAGAIGGLVLKNRMVRAATSETMATADGAATDALVKLYSDLARGGAGLIITGHIYVEPRGHFGNDGNR